MKEKPQNHTGREKEDADDSMRGFKTKDVPKPEQFDMAPEEFEEWHELFKAQLLSQDSKWAKVLEFMDGIKRGEGPFDEEKFKNHCEDTDKGEKIGETTRKETKSSLFVALLTNTKGETKEMVKKNKADKAFESYRYIITKGKNATALNIITVRARMLRPQPAATAKDVEACITKWKSDIAYITNVGVYIQDTENEKATLMNMLPEVLQLVMKPHLMSTLDVFER